MCYNSSMGIENIKFKIAELARTYDLDMVVLFGSRADNTEQEKSDVDIAYTRKEALSFDDELKLGNIIAPLFGACATDVVYLNKTSPVFMYEIMKKAKLLFSTNTFNFPNLFSYAVKRLHENMSLYNLKFDRLCKEYGV